MFCLWCAFENPMETASTPTVSLTAERLKPRLLFLLMFPSLSKSEEKRSDWSKVNPSLSKSEVKLVAQKLIAHQTISLPWKGAIGLLIGTGTGNTIFNLQYCTVHGNLSGHLPVPVRFLRRFAYVYSSNSIYWRRGNINIFEVSPREICVITTLRYIFLDMCRVCDRKRKLTRRKRRRMAPLVSLQVVLTVEFLQYKNVPVFCSPAIFHNAFLWFDTLKVVGFSKWPWAGATRESKAISVTESLLSF